MYSLSLSSAAFSIHLSVSSFPSSFYCYFKDVISFYVFSALTPPSWGTSPSVFPSFISLSGLQLWVHWSVKAKWPPCGLDGPMISETPHWAVTNTHSQADIMKALPKLFWLPSLWWEWPYVFLWLHPLTFTSTHICKVACRMCALPATEQC